jgi:hypothetical protein
MLLNDFAMDLTAFLLLSQKREVGLLGVFFTLPNTSDKA